jgi:Uncharacterized conserved protein
MKLKIIPTLAYLCMLSALLALGMWQLDRSEQKRTLLKLQEQAVVTETLHLSAVMENIGLQRYRQVSVTGRYDAAHQFLIDNQISGGKAGYFVLTPFVVSGGSKAILVNRGWIPLNQDRSILPELQINNPEATITGRINDFPSVGIKLAGAEIPTEGWPSVVQVVDSAVLTKSWAMYYFNFSLSWLKNYLMDISEIGGHQPLCRLNNIQPMQFNGLHWH